MPVESSLLFEMDRYVHHLFNRAVIRSCKDEFLAFHDEVTFFTALLFSGPES